MKVRSGVPVRLLGLCTEQWVKGYKRSMGDLKGPTLKDPHPAEVTLPGLCRWTLPSAPPRPLAPSPRPCAIKAELQTPGWEEGLDTQVRPFPAPPSMREGQSQQAQL